MKKHPKIPKSAKAFINSPIGEKSEFAKLFSDRKLKNGLGADTYIAAAKLLATGFDAKKYSGKIKRKKLRQAKLLLQDFYDLSTQSGKVKIFRPSKGNRKLYAKELAVSSKFKLYAMPVFTDDDVYKIIVHKGKRKLKLSGMFLDTELFEFPSMENAAKNPIKEINKLLRRIGIKYGNQIYDMKIKCGNYLSHFTTDITQDNDKQNQHITSEILLYFERYNPNTKKWLRGIQVTTFKNQQSYEVAKERRGGKYLEKKKPKKQQSKRDRIKGR